MFLLFLGASFYRRNALSPGQSSHGSHLPFPLNDPTNAPNARRDFSRQLVLIGPATMRGSFLFPRLPLSAFPFSFFFFLASVFFPLPSWSRVRPRRFDGPRGGYLGRRGPTEGASHARLGHEPRPSDLLKISIALVLSYLSPSPLRTTSGPNRPTIDGAPSPATTAAAYRALTSRSRSFSARARAPTSLFLSLSSRQEPFGAGDPRRARYLVAPSRMEFLSENLRCPDKLLNGGPFGPAKELDSYSAGLTSCRGKERLLPRNQLMPRRLISEQRASCKCRNWS